MRRSKGMERPDDPVQATVRLLMQSYRKFCSLEESRPSPAVLKALQGGLADSKAPTKFCLAPVPREKKPKINEIDPANQNQSTATAETGVVLPLVQPPPPEGAVQLVPLVSAIREHNYRLLRHLFVWNLPLADNDLDALSAMLDTLEYPLVEIELQACLLHNVKPLRTFIRAVAFAETVNSLNLSYNNFGDLGCVAICEELIAARSVEKLLLPGESNVGCNHLNKLVLNYCELSPVSGKCLNKLICQTSISCLFLDGNQLSVTGVVQLITGLAQQAQVEHKERLEASCSPQQARPLSALTQIDAKAAVTDPVMTNQERVQTAMSGELSADEIQLQADESPMLKDKKKKKKRSKKSKDPKPDLPKGPFLHELSINDNLINIEQAFLARIFQTNSESLFLEPDKKTARHTFNATDSQLQTAINLVQMFRCIVERSNHLKELHLQRNRLGQSCCSALADALGRRKQAKLPALRVSAPFHLQHSLFTTIHNAASGGKKKKKRRKKSNSK